MAGNHRTGRGKGEKMNINDQKPEQLKQPIQTRSIITGLVIGGLVGAGTMLLFAPQAGKKTRAEIQEGAIHLRDQTTEKVKDTMTQVRSKADQIKADVQIKAEKLQHQGQDLFARQLERFSHAAETMKKEIQPAEEHKVV
jgi:gas vesicle protein